MKKSFQIFKNVMTSHYINLNGRVSRPGYWHFMLWIFIIAIPLIALDFVVFGVEDEDLTLFTNLWELAIFLPATGLAIRRLHDINRTGWWIVIPYAPLIASLVFIDYAGLALTLSTTYYILALVGLVFTCQKSDPEDNQYGAPVHLD
jgi:uncharacterized membrane protein YhaH (DUF805 family)